MSHIQADENDKRILYVAAPGGVPENLCDGCVRPTDWSRDGKKLLTFKGNPYQVSLLDAASHEQTTLLAHPTYSLLLAHFSPDNRWVSFTARVQPNRAWIMIAPIDGPLPVPEASWIKFSEEKVFKTQGSGRPMGKRSTSPRAAMGTFACGPAGSTRVDRKSVV